MKMEMKSIKKISRRNFTSSMTRIWFVNIAIFSIYIWKKNNDNNSFPWDSSTMMKWKKCWELWKIFSFSSIHVMHFQFINNKDMNFPSAWQHFSEARDSNWRYLICIVGAVKVYVTLFQNDFEWKFYNFLHIESWDS